MTFEHGCFWCGRRCKEQQCRSFVGITGAPDGGRLRQGPAGARSLGPRVTGVWGCELQSPVKLTRKLVAALSGPARHL
ncbi:TPA: hypothetical protein UMX25_001293 [Stenotrophomonas maltophilia]|nr:hypothetical protein [Stenotrophomonas maltophilia]HEL4226767.1 hypothetical protein [Stenotrophomonas maltophilia]